MLTTDQFSNMNISDDKNSKNKDPKIVLEVLHDVRDAVGESVNPLNFKNSNF